jgi:hypothetical protein
MWHAWKMINIYFSRQNENRLRDLGLDRKNIKMDLNEIRCAGESQIRIQSMVTMLKLHCIKFSAAEWELLNRILAKTTNIVLKRSFRTNNLIHLKQSVCYYMYRLFYHSNSAFCPLCLFMVFVWFNKQTCFFPALTSCFFFLMEKLCILWSVDWISNCYLFEFKVQKS